MKPQENRLLDAQAALIRNEILQGCEEERVRSLQPRVDTSDPNKNKYHQQSSGHQKIFREKIHKVALIPTQEQVELSTLNYRKVSILTLEKLDKMILAAREKLDLTQAQLDFIANSRFDKSHQIYLLKLAQDRLNNLLQQRAELANKEAITAEHPEQ